MLHPYPLLCRSNTAFAFQMILGRCRLATASTLARYRVLYIVPMPSHDGPMIQAGIPGALELPLPQQYVEQQLLDGRKGLRLDVLV